MICSQCRQILSAGGHPHVCPVAVVECGYVDEAPARPFLKPSADAETMPEIATGASLDALIPIVFPTMSRIRTLCEPCKGEGVIGTHAYVRCCGACGGWGYTDESDADFRARMMEVVKAERETQTRFTLTGSDNIFDVLYRTTPAIPCEHAPGVTCINCDTGHGTGEGSA